MSNKTEMKLYLYEELEVKEYTAKDGKVRRFAVTRGADSRKRPIMDANGSTTWDNARPVNWVDIFIPGYRENLLEMALNEIRKGQTVIFVGEMQFQQVTKNGKTYWNHVLYVDEYMFPRRSLYEANGRKPLPFAQSEPKDQSELAPDYSYDNALNALTEQADAQNLM